MNKRFFTRRSYIVLLCSLFLIAMVMGIQRTTSSLLITSEEEAQKAYDAVLEQAQLSIRLPEEKGKRIGIEETEDLAILQSLEIKLVEIDNQKKVLEVDGAKAVWDTTVSVEGRWEEDKRQLPVTLSGPETHTSFLRTGVNKTLPTGTTLDITAGGTRTAQSSPFVTLNPSYNGAIEIALRQPVLKNFFGFIDHASLKITRLDVEKFDYETRDRIENSVMRARAAYWQLARARSTFKTRREALKRAQDFWITTRDNLDLGLAETTDLHAAEANLRIRDEEVLVAYHDYENGSEELKLILDYYPEGLLIPDGITIEEHPVHKERSLERAFEHRRDLKQAQIDLEKNETNLKVTGQSQWPQVDLLGTYTLDGLERHWVSSLNEALKSDNPRYFVGFEISVPLENRTARMEHLQASLDLKANRINLKLIENQIHKEVDEKVRKVELARKIMAQAQEVENLQSMKLAEEDHKFSMGRSRSETVIDYQEDLIEASLVNITAKISYLEAIDELKRAENTLLRTTHGNHEE